MKQIARRVAALYAELKRRHVVRVAAIYAGVAFAILEGVDLLVNTLELPGWITTALVVTVLLGFPVALLLAWALELSADTGGAVTTEVPAGPGPGTRRMAVGALLSVTAVTLAVGAWLVSGQLRDPPPDSMVAVLPFHVMGNPGLEYLGAGMVDLLSRNLDGAGGTRTVEPGAVLRLVGEPTATAMDVERGDGLARRLNAGRFVLGSINELAGTVRVSAGLYEAGKVSSAVKVAQAEGSVTDLFQLIDEISRQILAGLPAGAVSRGLIETATRTTRSIPALRAYLAGEQALRSAMYDSALTSFRRAVDADSSFALAYYRIGVASWWAGQPSSGAGAVNRAVAHAARLSPRDRRLLGAYAAMYQGHADVAERRYREILADYPDDSEARFQLAEMLHHYNAPRGRPPGEAREPFNLVLAADPKFACPI